MCSELGLEAAICCPPEQGYMWDVLHLKWCYSLFPAHGMPLCRISRSPIWIVSHWLSLRKGVFLFLCVTCLFHLARPGQCNTSKSSSSFALTSSSWRSPRVGSKVEKVTREGICSKHLKKEKRIKPPNTVWHSWKRNQDQNECSDPQIIATRLMLLQLKTMFRNYPMLPTCNRKLLPQLHSAALLNAVQHSIFITRENTYWHAPFCMYLLARARGNRKVFKSPEVGWWEELSSAKYQQQDQCSTSSSALAGFQD